MTVLQRGAQCLEAGDVSGELENPKDPENPEDLGGLGQVVQGVVGVDAVKAQGEEEGQDAQQVDHVQEGEQELPLDKNCLCWLTHNIKARIRKWPGIYFTKKSIMKNRIGQPLELQVLAITFLGETAKRMMYSRVNQTTKVASAIWKNPLSSLSSSLLSLCWGRFQVKC